MLNESGSTRRTYLVTGGAGFIGSHLVEALLARGDLVIALDNLSTGRLRNLDAVGQHANFRFVHGSVLDDLLVDELVHESDVVVHLAAAVGVQLIVEKPLRSFTTNIRGSETVIEAAHRYRRRILLASTSEIYGKNGNGGVPLVEDADRLLGSPSVARWAYSTAKVVDEILAYAYHRERGLATTVARLFNTVGPRQSPAYGMVIPRLVRQAVRAEPLTVYGDGRQTRCFCHVLDVVDGLLRLIDDPRTHGECFNLGSQEEVSILELAQRILETAESSSPIELVPYEKAYVAGFEDMRRRVPDIGKVRGLTGWSPRRTLDDILAETIVEARAELAGATAGLS
ncbi:MAG TPA: NAD-dependent epimerase/dehydratase family protein [Acidimicrobiales bacterium]|nr:NAD-dependent epimerase/dehydratase family protein [Acidimicrobiales bacterium]